MWDTHINLTTILYFADVRFAYTCQSVQEKRRLLMEIDENTHDNIMKDEENTS